MLTKNAVK